MGRPQTQETKEKLKIKAKHWMDDLKKDPVAWEEYRKKQSEATSKRYLHKEINRIKYLTETSFDQLGLDSRRDKIIFEQNGKCARCHNDKWFEVQLTLEIDHINGFNQDNRRENLIALCPNCHSITPTWRGRNKNSCNKITDKVAIEAIKNEPSIRQALIRCGLTPKGGNYKRFTKLKKNLDF